jgi:NTE family protein
MIDERTVKDDARETTSEAASEGLLADGMGLALSGGGYRAMLFHLGVLRALNGLGLLPSLTRVSSVSGGSITAGTLACHWRKLSFDDRGRATNFDDEVTERLCALASRSIDIRAGLRAFLPGTRSSHAVRDVYRKLLVGDATLQDLPADGEAPRFILTAANVQTGALFRMSRPYMADWKLGRWRAPALTLATAMAASSAFPPFLSPLAVEPGALPDEPEPEFKSQNEARYSRLCRRIVLTDGGVYDNFGLEPLHKRLRTILVSDAGQRLDYHVKPWLNWFSQLLRIREMFDDQVRALRMRWLAEHFDQGQRHGVYFSIRGEIVTRDIWDSGAGAAPESVRLAAIATRLKALPRAVQEALMGWGAQQCMAALRSAKAANALPPLIAARIELKEI